MLKITVKEIVIITTMMEMKTPSVDLGSSSTFSMISCKIQSLS